jgi:hypothetical protein
VNKTFILYLVLFFIMLCIAGFTLFTYTSARNEMAHAQAEAAFLKGYYEADVLAGRIIAELIISDIIPDMLFGVFISSSSPSPNSSTIAFSIYISDGKELSVQTVLTEDSYEVLKWEMRSVNNYNAP